MVGTIELNTGLQISGKFERMLKNEDNEVIFFKTEGPTALAFREKELIGHGIETHHHGFSSPLGKLKNINLSIEDMGPLDLKAYNFYDGKKLSFEFESGIHVEGVNVTGIRNLHGKLMLIQLKDCTVTYREEVLFQPEWGMFDMVVGSEIISAFAGAADFNSFPNLYDVSQTLTVQAEKTDADIQKEDWYAEVRRIRDNKEFASDMLSTIATQTMELYPNEWLLLLEILEIIENDQVEASLFEHLQAQAKENKTSAHLILEGIEMITHKSFTTA